MEESHADALCTVAPNNRLSLMSQHSENEPVMRGEMRVWCTTIQDGVREGVANLFRSAVSIASNSGALHSAYTPSVPWQPGLGDLASANMAFGVQNPQLAVSAAGSYQPAGSVGYSVLQPQYQQHSAVAASTEGESASPTLPPPGLSIPDLRNREKALELVISHWKNSDPGCGLLLALKDWPMSWYSGANKNKFAMKRFTRQVVATEYLEV